MWGKFNKADRKRTRYNVFSLPIGFVICLAITFTIYLSLDKSEGPQMGPEAGFVTNEGIVILLAIAVGAFIALIMLLLWLVRVIRQIVKSKSRHFQKVNLSIVVFYLLAIFFSIFGHYIYNAIFYEIRESNVIEAQYEIIDSGGFEGQIVAAYPSQDTLYLLTLSVPIDHDERDVCILQYPHLVSPCKVEKKFYPERNLRFYAFHQNEFIEIPGLRSPMIDSIFYMNSHEIFLKYAHFDSERKRLGQIDNPDTTMREVIHLKPPNCNKVRIVGNSPQYPARLVSGGNKTLVNMDGYYNRHWLNGGNRYMVSTDPAGAVGILAPTFHDEFDEDRNDHYIYIADAQLNKQKIYKLKVDHIPQIKVCAKVGDDIYIFRNLGNSQVLRIIAKE